MGAPDDERTGLYYIGCTTHHPEIAHFNLETFTQGASRHVDHHCTNKDPTLHYENLNGCERGYEQIGQTGM